MSGIQSHKELKTNLPELKKDLEPDYRTFFIAITTMLDIIEY